MQKKWTGSSLLFLLTFVIINACNTKKPNGGFTITVNYKNTDKMMPQNFAENPADALATGIVINPHILLEEVPFGSNMQPVLLDSAVLKGKNGEIELHGLGKEEGIYQLTIEKGPIVLLINDAENITVDIDLSKKDNYYSISGSPASDRLKTFIAQYDEKAVAINKTFVAIDSLKQISGSDSLLVVATNNKNQAITSLNTYLTGIVNNASSPAETLFALGMSSRSFQKDEFGKLMNTVIKKFPDNKALAQQKVMFDAAQAKANTQKETSPEASSSWVGKLAPDLAMPSVDDKIISIASFKGKYLLVDFWASWCGPCRNENPTVVNAYNKFKNKNFTILGVSLDRPGEKERWLKAIQDDQLAWTHISDLQFWNSKAVEIFKFQGIPYNILIDPKGIIIAEGLRGADLENKLSEVLK